MNPGQNSVAALFAGILDEGSILVGLQLNGRDPGYCGESYGAGVLLRPRDAQQLAEICRVASRHGVSLVPHGGLTGLVEGTTSHDGQAVISFERMNRIHRIDAAQGIAVVDAGVTLEALQNALEPMGLTFGVDIPARGSCMIGGMAATNAGGIRVLRYGMMRPNVLGLEAVLADGRILDMTNPLLKNNAGYDLKHLFIGSEGTLGMITRVVLRLWPAERFTSCALISCPEAGSITTLFEQARAQLDSALLAFEAMWPSYYELTTSQPGFPQRPLALGSKLYGVIEVAGRTREASEERLLSFLETALETGILLDAVVAQSEADRTAIWRSREDSDAINHHFAESLSYDIGLELKDVNAFTERLTETFARDLPQSVPHVFGHVGDGNLHVLIGVTESEHAERAKYDRIIYETLTPFAGSTISAEHGIGLEKRPYLEQSLPSPVIGVMRELKAALDPQNILNPGKVFST